MKKLSIVVPMYNVAEYVINAAKSIDEQAHNLLEVVAVDDGSTDNSLGVFLENLTNVDVVVVRQANLGLSAARNAGILAASGTYILFLDADDFLLPASVENILKIISIDTPDLIYGRMKLWTPNLGVRNIKQYEYKLPECRMDRIEYILGSLPDSSWNAVRCICKRNFLQENELFFIEGILCEDVPWTLAVLDTANVMCFLEEPFYAYFNRRPGSITNCLSSKKIIDLNKIVLGKLQQYANRPRICTLLIWQSFIYISEYCLFSKQDRRRIYKSYKNVMPYYRKSMVFMHRFMGLIFGRLLLYFVSTWMFAVRRIYRIFAKIRPS